MDRQQLASVWESGIAPAVGGLQDNAAARGLRLDYSIESLRAVESATRDLFETAERMLSLQERSLVQALMAYVGLSLIHLTGGRWEWDGEPGLPQRDRPPLTDGSLADAVAAQNWAWPDAEEAAVGIPIAVPGDGLGLEPVSSLHLLLATVAEQPGNDGGPLVRTYFTWQAKVTNPPKPGVVGIDIFDAPSASSELEAWLTARRQEFAEWASRYPGTWDYSPESIDALTERTFTLTPTTDDFNDPANADFVEGASWYAGEVLLRTVPARWVHRPHMAARDGAPAVAGYQVQRNDDADTASPFRLLRLSITTKEHEARGLLREWVNHLNGGQS